MDNNNSVPNPNPVPGMTQQPMQTSVAQVAPETTMVATPVEQAVTQQTPPAPVVTQPAEKPSSKLPLILGILAFVIVLIASAYVFLVNGSKAPANAKNNKMTAQEEQVRQKSIDSQPQVTDVNIEVPQPTKVLSPQEKIDTLDKDLSDIDAVMNIPDVNLN